LLSFADGAFASLTYSGYAHFDSDEFCGNIGEMGAPSDLRPYGIARESLRRAASPEAELALKNARNFGGDHFQKVAARDAPRISTSASSWFPANVRICVRCRPV
jgi:phthalate 4,5-cis-dihydrodiol dehydrogenase